jgi:hypothetical protein
MIQVALKPVVDFEASQDAGWAANFLDLEGSEHEVVRDQWASFGERLAVLEELFDLTFGSVPSD